MKRIRTKETTRPFYNLKYKIAGSPSLSLFMQEEVLPVSLNETSGMHGCVGAKLACVQLDA